MSQNISIVSFTQTELNVEVFLILSVIEAIKYWHHNKHFFLPGNLN